MTKSLQVRDSMHTPAPVPHLPPRTIAIVGAGFSGTSVAINLLRLAGREPLHIVLIDRGNVGRGLAFAKRPFPYLLNVPAGRMSASSVDPDGFLEYARRQHPYAGAEDFLPRELYGDYLESSLTAAERTSASCVRLERVRGSVIALERQPRDGALDLLLEDRSRLRADAVVLALGNPPPARLRAAASLVDSPQYVSDPWAQPLRFRGGERVLIVGTGLTMADVTLAAHGMSKGGAQVHAISRHGLLPPTQSNFRPLVSEAASARLLSAAGISLKRLVREARALAEDAQLRGGDWREVIGLVRGLGPRLWAGLNSDERRRFLRHVRCYWDAHRHRLPECTWNTLNEMRRHGKLRIDAGRILRLEHRGPQVRVTWRPRGAGATSTLLVDRVINCTGPDYDLRSGHDRLLRSLLAQGLAQPDPLGLGLLTDERGALQDGRGRGPGRLYYLGPMLRPRHWEVTAVQELRVYAEQLAAHLAAPVAFGDRVTSASPSAGISSVRVPPSSGRTLGAGSVAALRSSASWR
jgi:uncharacterized NAD(P)/FAD-binding protein YdhS